MTTTQILLFAFAGIGALATISIISIAWRRGDGTATGSVDRKAMRGDPAVARRWIAAPAPALAGEGRPVVVAAPIDPLEARQELDEESYGMTRRRFFNRGILGVFGLFLAQFGVASLAFMWPRLKSGGFGSEVNAGKIEDLKIAALTEDGRVQPVVIAAAQAYVVPVQGSLEGSSFDGLPVVAAGFMALWHRCVHLGCRVPECDTSLGFECPCHGSKYNFHGEYEDGPAPRNMDRFLVSISEDNELIIDTGTVIETARASVKTVEYPEGPTCI
ncbi:MAG: ubiquinol-cytochrome c reductase iron-sulfur subunit [Acidobacteria bacterium]|nr:ubiquinol-cytochrome c reductase iron-sulfur subunit [Acidobacteriota bacterium]